MNLQPTSPVGSSIIGFLTLGCLSLLLISGLGAQEVLPLPAPLEEDQTQGGLLTPLPDKEDTTNEEISPPSVLQQPEPIPAFRPLPQPSVPDVQPSLFNPIQPELLPTPAETPGTDVEGDPFNNPDLILPPQERLLPAPGDYADPELTEDLAELETSELEPAEELVSPSPLSIDSDPFAYANSPELFNNSQSAALARHTSLSREEGFTFSVEGGAEYNSNILLSEDEESSFETFLRPSVTYRSSADRSASFNFLSSYTPSIHVFWEDSDLNNVGHDFDAALSYSGGPLSLQLATSFYQNEGANRFSGTRSESTRGSASLSATYQLSGKTGLTSSVLYSTSEIDDERSENSLNRSRGASSVVAVNFGGYWQATPLIKIGPNLRYATSESAFGTERDSLGLSAVLNYELSGKTELVLSAGIERVDSSFQGSSTNPTGGFSLNYKPTDFLQINADAAVESITVDDDLNRNFQDEDGLPSNTTNQENPFSWGLSVRYDRGARYFAGATINSREGASLSSQNAESRDFTQSLFVGRRFGTSVLTATLRYSQLEQTSFDQEQQTGLDQDNDVLTAGLLYYYPGLFDRFNWRSSLEYREGRGSREYENILLRTSLSYQF